MCSRLGQYRKNHSHDDISFRFMNLPPRVNPVATPEKACGAGLKSADIGQFFDSHDDRMVASNSHSFNSDRNE